MIGLTPCKQTNLVTSSSNGFVVTKTNVARGFRTNLFYLYEATLPGLSPGTLYSYSLQVGGVTTATHQFKTQPSHRRVEKRLEVFR